MYMFCVFHLGDNVVKFAPNNYLLSKGVKFIAITDKLQQKVPDLLRKIYELYSDYVLKNPFYSLDMPIK